MVIEQEIWKDIPGYEGYYLVSNYGRVKSLDMPAMVRGGKFRISKGRILAGGKTKTGYHFVDLYKNSEHESFYVHRLVATMFIQNPSNKPQVNHKNGIKDDNRVENIEWATQSENNFHARRTGLNPKIVGSETAKAVLDEEFVKEVRRLCKDHTSHEIMQLLQWPKSARHLIANIRCGRIWKHVVV